VFSVLVFLSKSVISEDRIGKETTNISDHLVEGEEHFQEGNSLFIIKKTIVEPDEPADNASPWKEVSMKVIDETLESMAAGEKKRRSKLESVLRSYDYIGSLSFLVCGTTKNYWIEPEVDLSAVIGDATARETFFTGMSSTLKLDILNQGIFVSDEIRGNRINSVPFDVNLYAFRPGNTNERSRENILPTNILLDYDVDDDSKNSSEDTPGGMFSNQSQTPFSYDDDGGEEKKTTTPEIKDIHYRTHMENLIKIISRFMAYHLVFNHFFQNDHKEFQKNAAQMRENIQGLQSNINSILLKDEEGKKKKAGSKAAKSGALPTEDDIIYSSSVFSSSLTEIDENVSNLILYFTDRFGKVERTETEAQFDRMEEVPELGDVLISLSDEMKTWRETVLTSFSRLRSNLSNSQNRLRNTIDVFNSYRESKRRKNQKKTANMLNFVFVALAIIELSDFFSGLITYALGQEPYDWAGAGVMFLIAISFLLLIALMIYIFLLRKMWKAE